MGFLGALLHVGIFKRIHVIISLFGDNFLCVSVYVTYDVLSYVY